MGGAPHATLSRMQPTQGAATMQVNSIQGPVTMAHVERAHSSLNAAYNAVTAHDQPVPSGPGVIQLAREYVDEARRELHLDDGHAGNDVARTAARAVLPRLERALQLLGRLEVERDAAHLTPLLDEIGAAMDHVEEALVAVGWD
jgi:hypothetical protein